MEKQDYHNHIFYYWPHHGGFYAMIIISFILSGLGIWQYGLWPLWAMIELCIFMILYLGFMTRQHYALGNQNRTVRLELRLRYYILTQKRLEAIESKLTFKQLAALRFASDADLPSLIDAAVSENLTPDQIKKRIHVWLPDTMRV